MTRLPRLLWPPEMQDRRLERRLEALLRRISLPVLRSHIPFRIALDETIMEIPPKWQKSRPLPVKRVPRILFDPIRDVVVRTVPRENLLPGLLFAALFRIEDNRARIKVTFRLRRQNSLPPDRLCNDRVTLAVLRDRGNQVVAKIEVENLRHIVIEKHVDVEMRDVSGRIGEQHRRKDRRPGEDVPPRLFAVHDQVRIRHDSRFNIDVTKRKESRWRWTKAVLISLSTSFLHLFSSQFIEFFNNQLKFVLAIR